MRFLVLGSTGMAGHMIASYLVEKGHEVSGTYRQEASVLDALQKMGMRALFLDAADPTMLSAVVRPSVYDAVVNCVGLLNRACDENPALAVRLNSLLPHRLEALTAGTDCRVVHISTDCVFAGNTGPYTEDSEPDGATLYDLTKAAGEICNGKDLTLRQSIVGPDPDPGGIGLLNWFMSQKGSVNGYSRAMWTGLTTLELARSVEACACVGATGLVNMVPKASISKLDLLHLFNRELRGGTIDIRTSDDVVIDKSLLNGRRISGFEPAPYEQQIVDLAQWMYAHSNFYPHYDFAWAGQGSCCH